MSPMPHFAGKAIKVAILSAMTALLLSGFAMAAENEYAAAIGVTTGSALRLRQEPTTASSILTTLNKDVALAVLDTNTPDWIHVSYNGSTGYVSAEYVAVTDTFTSYGRVNTVSNLRTAPSLTGDVVTTLDKDTIVTVNALEDGWYKVTCKYGTEGYIRSDLLDLTATAEAVSSGDGSSIVSAAKKYLGVHYVYGGASPSGFDCSGFTMYIYKQFGYSLPHTASGQWQSGLGTRVNKSALQAGDLVFFNDPSRNAGKACSHAGIYIGGGQFIHASSSRSGGVIISDLTSGYYATYFVGGIHV